MNENVNVTGTQSSELSKSKSNKELAELTKNQSKKRKTGQEMLQKYFVPRNPKEVFRILPPKAGKRIIEQAFFHVVTTKVAGGKIKHGTIIYCPAGNDPRVKKTDKNGQVILDEKNLPVMIPAPCPLCEKAEDLLLTQDPSVKFVTKEKSATLPDAQKAVYDKNNAIFKESRTWQAKKFYIVRGIDKGVPIDGVKFWRFKHNFLNTGTLNKLLPALQEFNDNNQVDYTNVQNGGDLIINTVDANNNGIRYIAIVGITARKSVLSSDISNIREWLADDITWREVFLPKKAPNTTAYQYLEMIAAGINPYWDNTDSNNKHWVFPNNPELENLANTKTRDLDADNKDREYASDLDAVDEEYQDVPDSITQVTAPVSNVVNVPVSNQVEIPASIEIIETEDNQNESNDAYKDLPF